MKKWGENWSLFGRIERTGPDVFFSSLRDIKTIDHELSLIGRKNELPTTHPCLSDVGILGSGATCKCIKL
jgi:hypothetical protein